MRHDDLEIVLLVLLDASIIEVTLDPAQKVGASIHVKLLSENQGGGGLESTPPPSPPIL